MSAPGKLPSQFGRYRILRELGAGGMGAVYLAEDSHLNRRVALKVPHFAAADGPQALQRFLREAQIVAGIRHEHICLVHDLGQIESTHFLIMEYVEGTSLAQYLEQGQPCSPRAAVKLLRKLALAVQVLHTHGVIHRDLKPSNILLRPNGEPVLLDFGLARPLSPQNQELTATGTLLGTPAYMSPEQIRTEKDIGPATDIYSLGVILYELLTGERPFPGPSFGELTGQILYGKLEPPSRRRPGLDAALNAICMKAMARNAAERYPTAQAFATALAAYRPTQSAVPAPPEILTATPAVGGQASTLRSGSQASETFALPAKRRLPRYLLLLGFLAGCTLLGLLALSGGFGQLSDKKTPKLDSIVLELGNDVTMTFVRIPAAGRKFWMGSPMGEDSRSSDEDQVEVEFTRDFWMAIHETTQAQYTAITGKANPSYFTKDKSAGLDTLQFPVEQVSWEDADACVKDLNRRFAATLGKKLGARECWFGLPTEAQWEYACRGGATDKNSLPFHFKAGPTASLSSVQANFDGNYPSGNAGKGQYLQRTTTVGAYEPNRFGLFDMHGNVAEWCGDYYGPLVGGREPERTTMHNENRRVVRGGSWLFSGRLCRAANRSWDEPGVRDGNLGFRVVFCLDL